MTDSIRIANCSGFYGDRRSAAAEMVGDGPIDVLTGDWLAELTMLILARTRAKRPGGGYARTFVTQMEQVMGTCLDKGIKVVSNAGGLDPDHCAEAVAAVADKLGLSPTIAYVNGDNLLPRLDELRAQGIDLIDFETKKPVADVDYISANAYLGCWGIVEALNRGADIVVTGRTTDAAIVCGPAAWHHGWKRDDWDRLGGAVVAGHVIECGTQATGGNYSFFAEIDGLERAGFPYAEIAADGSCVIGKHPGTGGAVTIGTVTSQLLYEIGGPDYLGPDVTSRFDTIQLAEVGPDRIRISGTRGEPPPSTLKVSMNSWGGFRSDLSIALTGIDIDAKAALVEAAFWRACNLEPDDFESVTSSLIPTAKDDPATNEEAVASWKITVKDQDERKTKSVGSALNDLALATIPGFFGLPGGGLGKPFGVHTSGLIAADLVPQNVVLLGREPTVIDSVAPNRPVSVTSTAAPAVDVPGGKTVRAALGLIVGSRSGDKGGNANLGVFARSGEAFAWLDDMLTVEKLRELLPEAADLRIERHPLSNLWSINFVIHDMLQKGVASSTRQDGQAKGLGEWLRARHVDIPLSLLETPSQRNESLPGTSIAERLGAVKRPKAVLDRDAESAITRRQREVLGDLEQMFNHGFAHLTMAEIASGLNCSLRTLYGLAPSRDMLVLMVIDRRLWAIGRTARDAIRADMSPLDAIRAYLARATVAVGNTTPEFAADIAAMQEARDLNEAHSNYLVDVTECLLDLAVDSGDIGPVDTAAVARIMAGLGREFARPNVLVTLRSTPKEAADAVVDLMIAGLRQTAHLPARARDGV